MVPAVTLVLLTHLSQRLGIRIYLSAECSLTSLYVHLIGFFFATFIQKQVSSPTPHGSEDQYNFLKNPLSLNCTPNPVSLDILLTEMDSGTINGPLTSKCIWMQPLSI